jgi:hypothetical protein
MNYKTIIICALLAGSMQHSWGFSESECNIILDTDWRDPLKRPEEGCAVLKRSVNAYKQEGIPLCEDQGGIFKNVSMEYIKFRTGFKTLRGQGIGHIIAHLSQAEGIAQRMDAALAEYRQGHVREKIARLLADQHKNIAR